MYNKIKNYDNNNNNNKKNKNNNNINLYSAKESN